MTPGALLDVLTRARGAVVADYVLVGSRVRLAFATEALAAAFGPALDHARAPSGPPELVVTVTDAPALPPVAESFAAAGGVLALRGPSLTVVLDPARGVGAAHVGALAPWDQGRPLRALLGWWAAARGLQLAHGAAVGTPGGAVLLVGSGGSGKSTAAATCWLRGMPFLGDDQVVVGGDPPRVYPLYASVAADPDTLATRLAGLPRAGAVHAPGDKSWCFLPHGVAGPLPLAAIAATRVGPTTGWRRASPAEALLAVGAQSLLWQPGDRAAGLRRLADLVRRVPCFVLTLGPDPADTPAAVAALSSP